MGFTGFMGTLMLMVGVAISIVEIITDREEGLNSWDILGAVVAISGGILVAADVISRAI